MKVKTLSILLCLSLGCKFSVAATALTDLEHIAVSVYGATNDTLIKANEFYPVYMSAQGEPYINVGKFFKDFFNYQVIPKGSDLVIQSVPNRGKIIFDIQKGQVDSTIKQIKPTLLPAGSFQVIKGQLWVKYTDLKSILQGTARWTQSSYSLLVTTGLPVLAVLKSERAEKIESAKKAQAQQAIQAKQAALLDGNLPTLYPPAYSLNTQVRYQLGTTQTLGQGAGNQRTAGFNTVTDLLTGTLSTSGSYHWPYTGSSPISWNYKLQKEPYFANLQLGYVSSNATLFSNYTALKNGITFSRLAQGSPSLNFYYTGQTLPGTEIDVWRNGGYLLSSFVVGQNGQYIIQDPSATPGNIYEIDYYYSNGTSAKTFVRYTANENMLLGQRQWDVTGTAGQMISGDTTAGQYTETNVRAGILPNLTAGVGLFNIPTNAQLIAQDGLTSPYSTSYYLNTYWQVFPSLGVLYNQILNNGGGYAFQAFSDYFSHHSIQLLYKNLPEVSPFLYLSSSSIQYQAWRFFLAQDNWSLPKGFNLQTQYQVSNLQNQITTALSGYINNYLVPSVEAGWAQTPGAAYQPTLKLGNTFNLNSSNSLQYTSTWTRGTPMSNGLTYVFRPLSNKFSVSGGVQQGGGQAFSYSWSATWNPTPDWSLQVAGTKNKWTIGVSYVGAASLNGLMQNPNNFGMGTVEGVIMAPKTADSKTEPQAGVQVTAGGASAVTNKHGQFKIEGVPTNQKIKLQVDPGSISTNFAPRNDSVSIFLRPGTVIDYNPLLTQTIGIDGVINIHYNSHQITEGAYILAESKSGHLRRIGLIDPGTHSFVVNNLNPGTYKLMLEGVKNPPDPVIIVIKPADTWISNVAIDW